MLINTILFTILFILIGSIIGLIIGYFIFFKTIYKGPDSNVIIKQIYVDSNNKQFKYIPQVCICPLHLSTEKLKNINYVHPNH